MNALMETEARRPPTKEPQLVWTDVCALEDIWPNSGVAALVEGVQIALVRVGDSAVVHGLSNFDPFSEAFVIARGIVGDRNGRPKIASPIFKQNFDLETGVCMDDPSVSLIVYPTRVRDGRVEVAVVVTQAAQP
ncbi:MAG TPA: nitrite reductase small subunit NirD [Polyangia bacterium]|nr:nitrite reductase small subunit NirD [Polyangia bacterium]